MVSIFKALADDTRLSILRALGEGEMYTELIAQRLALSAPTVSFHMKKLMAAGLVSSRKEQYYVMYSLREEAFEMKLKEMLTPAGEDERAAQLQREEMYRRKVIRTFMPDGYCKTLPAQAKKRLVIYEEIFDQFTPGAVHTEKQVNEIIERMHEDYCLIRREFIGMGWMSRERGLYTVLTRNA